MKKVLSVALVLVLMLSFESVGFYASAETATGVTQYVWEDFSGYAEDKTFVINTSGQTLAGLTVLHSSKQPSGASVSASGDYLEVTGANGAGAFTLSNFTHTGKTHIVVEFDFMQPTKGKASKIFGSQNGSATVLGIALSSNGTALNAYDGNEQKVFMSSYNSNQWYKFTVCADLSTNTYDVYVDGKCLIKDWGFKLKDTVTSISNLGRIFGVEVASGQPAVRYKNINIYADDREEIISDAATALYISCPNGKISEGTISLPATDKSGYILTWTSSDSSVINTETGVVSEVKTDKVVTLMATAKDSSGERSIARKFDITVLAAPLAPGVTQYVWEDFSGYAEDETFVINTSGQTLAGLTVLHSSKQPSGASVSASGDYLEVTGVNGAGAFTLSNFTHTGKTHIVVEFDFMQPVKGVASKIFGSQNGSATVLGIALSSNGKALNAYDGDTLKVFMSSYNANQWYKFTVCADLSTNTYDVYVDGKCLIKDWGFKLKDTVTSISNLGRIFGVEVASGQPAVRYKNINIYADDREEIMSSAATALYTACPEGKISAGTISLPTTDASGYTLTWSSSDDSVINPETGVVSNVKVDKVVTLTASVADSSNEKIVSRKYDVKVLGAKIELETDGSKYIATATDVNIDKPSVIIATYKKGQMIDIALGEEIGEAIVAEIDTSTYSAGDYVVKVFALEEETVLPLTANIQAAFSITEES